MFFCFHQILQEALTELHKAGEDSPYYQPVKTYILNPKAVSMGELYGEVNKLTLEWQDGLMATIVRITSAVSRNSSDDFRRAMAVYRKPFLCNLVRSEPVSYDRPQL